MFWEGWPCFGRSLGSRYNGITKLSVVDSYHSALHRTMASVVCVVCAWRPSAMFFQISRSDRSESLEMLCGNWRHILGFYLIDDILGGGFNHF